MRTITLLLTVAALQFNGAWAADDAEFALTVDTPTVVPDDDESHFSQQGGVILDGQYIAPPYQIVAVEDGVDLNGHFVPEEGFHDRFRRRRDAQNTPPFADRVNRRLNEGAWLLGWENGEYGMVSEMRFTYIAESLAGEFDRNEKVRLLESEMISWIGPAEWQQLVERCELPATVIEQYVVTNAADPVLAASIVAPQRRFQTSIYLLTVFGIGATVFALGTLLSYRPIEKMPWSHVNLSKDATQLVLRSVVLLIGLALLDLVCTSLSARTASFWELNPLGAAVLSTPLLLGAFKIGATLLSGSILFALRRYHGAQVASWWLALFCTVLAIRWVTYNSMFMA